MVARRIVEGGVHAHHALAGVQVVHGANVDGLGADAGALGVVDAVGPLVGADDLDTRPQRPRLDNVDRDVRRRVDGDVAIGW